MKLSKLLFLFLFFSLPLLSQEMEQAITSTAEAIRLVPPGSQNTALFLKLSNSSNQDIYLVRAESSISKTVELHDMVMDSGKMMMRPISKILIPAKGSVELKPGSLHVMFLGLNTNLVNGETKKVKLIFDTNKSITINAPIKEMMGMMKKMTE
jgi:periplasmic copper chaperone A